MILIDQSGNRWHHDGDNIDALTGAVETVWVCREISQMRTANSIIKRYGGPLVPVPEDEPSW